MDGPDYKERASSEVASGPYASHEVSENGMPSETPASALHQGASPEQETSPGEDSVLRSDVRAFPAQS